MGSFPGAGSKGIAGGCGTTPMSGAMGWMPRRSARRMTHADRVQRRRLQDVSLGAAGCFLFLLAPN